MTALQPSPAEERWLVLAARLGEQYAARQCVARGGGWRSVRSWTRGAFFLLGLLAAAATLALFSLLPVPRFLFTGGLALVAVAEWLIVRQRLAAAGIEEALEAAGLMGIAIDVWQHLGSGHDVAGALLVATVFALAGLRLRNPLYATLAALAVSFALEFAIATPRAAPGRTATAAASAYCYGVAVLALLAGAVRLERPSHDRMLDWLVIVMPVAGYLWSAGDHIALAAVDYLHVRAPVALLTPLAPLAFALAALAFGLRRRTHAPLLACMLCTACVAWELRALSGWPLEARLIIWGGVALAAAVALERWLRRPRGGITSSKLRDREGAMGLLELAGAAALTPQPPAPQARGIAPGGGEFGGGGASGSF